MRRLVLVYVLFPVAAFGQVQLTLSTGYGSYSMLDLKSLQKELKSEFPVEPRITSSFPAYWYVEGTGTVVLNQKYFAGLAVAMGSTGGRITYSDYSGKIVADQIVNYVSFGIPVGLILNPENESWIFQLDARPGVTMSNLELRFQQDIGSQHDEQSLKFKSLNASLQPGFIIIKKIGAFGLVLQTGYNVTVYSGKLYLKNDRSSYLLNNSGKEVKTDWSGFRVSAGLCYFMHSH